jgi:hypothetical protein
MSSFELEQQEEAAPEANGIEKAGPACGICCCGWFVFPLALLLLGNNEKSYVCNNKNIIYAQESANVVECDKAVDDKFVFFSCPIAESSKAKFNMASFGNTGWLKPDAITFTSLAASQKVESYQCVQSCKDEYTGKGKDRKKKTTCNSQYQWATSQQPNPVLNKGYNKDNLNGCPGYQQLPTNIRGNQPMPTSMRAKAQGATTVKAGAYTLPPDMSGQFTATSTVSLAPFKSTWPSMLALQDSSEDAIDTHQTSAEKPEEVRFLAETDAATTAMTITEKNSNIDGNYLYYPKNCFQGTIKVGCTRISWMQNTDTYASAIVNSGKAGVTAGQATKSSWGCGAGNYDALYKQKKTKDEVIAAEQSANEGSLMVFRVIGVLGAWLAIYCCFYPIVAMADIMQDYAEMVPCIGPMLGFIGEIMETLVQVVVCCISCSLGCSAALFTIAVVWVIMRPPFGIALMVVCCCLCGGAYGLTQMVPKKHAEGGGENES